MLRDNNGWGVAQTLYGFGSLARARAATTRPRSATSATRWSCTARSTPGPRSPGAWPGIGWVALAQGDLALAPSSLTESLQLSLATGQRLAIARGLEAFAVLAVAGGDPARAVKLAGRRAGAARGCRPCALVAGAARRLDDLLEAARRQLGPAPWRRLLAEGAAMSAHEAVGFATGSDAR